MTRIVKDGHSHQLAGKYKRVADSGIDTRGDDYEIPTLPASDTAILGGKRVLIISADGPELPELDVPLEYLKAQGACINADRKGKTRNVLFPAGTRITGVPSIRVDLENAGFQVLDQDTVYDETCRLLTAPSPRELGPLCEEMRRLLASGAP